MSRIGRKPINIPKDVIVEFNKGVFFVKNKNVELSERVHPNMKISIIDNTITIERPNDEKFNKALHGLTRSLIFNMIEGVTKGFEKILELNGVGYRAVKQGNELVLSLGFSHQIKIQEKDNVTFEAKGNKIFVRGASKQKVGQFAANIRGCRPPEPYKGKGVKYADEIIRRKEGKAGKSAKK